MFHAKRLANLVATNIVLMSTIVSGGTLIYADLNRIKKRHQIAFRRYVSCQSPGKEISKYLGATRDEIRQWISGKMLEGMNWNNYGNIWVIDHIVPLRLFDMTNEVDLKIAWNFKNLMPLFSKDNLHKEGDLRFSLLIIEKLPPCEITKALIDCATLHIKKLDKYLLER